MMNILESKLNELVLSDEFSGNILIGSQNDILFEKAFGDAIAQLAEKKKLTFLSLIPSHTKLNTGSWRISFQ